MSKPIAAPVAAPDRMQAVDPAILCDVAIPELGPVFTARRALESFRFKRWHTMNIFHVFHHVLSSMLRNLFIIHLKRNLLAMLLTAIALNAVAAGCPPADTKTSGDYRLSGENPAVVFVSLKANGQFRFSVVAPYGEMVAYARGCWKRHGDTVTLESTQPETPSIFLTTDGPGVVRPTPMRPPSYGASEPDDGGDEVLVHLTKGLGYAEVWLEYADGEIRRQTTGSGGVLFIRKNMPPISRVGLMFRRGTPVQWVKNDEPTRREFVISAGDESTLPNAFDRVTMYVNQAGILSVHDGFMTGAEYQRAD